MKVNVAVCGRFHYHNYIKYLHQAGVLGRFYYSHKIATGSKALSVPADKLVNIWPKEYLVRGHLRLLGERGASLAFPFYATLWQTGVLKNYARCDIIHVMLHGTAHRVVERARRDGTAILGEPVNAHPEIMNRLLNEEYELLGINRHHRRLSLLQRRLVRESLACDALLVASRWIAQSYAEMGFDRKRMHVVPYGVDLCRFYPPTGLQRDGEKPPFRVVCIAAVSPRKGQIYLLEAWKRLALPKAELILVGAVQDEMKPILARYQGLFSHLGVVPNSELYRVLGTAAVFVLPSIEDGFACVVPEALACGVPVITTDHNGASDILNHGKDGFVVPIRSSESIAQHLERLYEDKGLREEMASAALAKAMSQLGWDRYADRLCDVYRDLVGKFEQSASGTASK